MEFSYPVAGAPTTLELSWRRTAGDGPAALDAWADLVARWTQPHRSYHGLTHLAAMLGFVDSHADLAADPDLVRLATWYHDAVYEPARTDNEERSAALAAQTLPGLDRPAAAVAEVVRLVLLTRTHQPQPDDANGVLLCDCDLAVLGAPPPAYAGYLNGIRAEYRHLSDADFRQGRSAVLHGLLERERIFRTEPIGTALEAVARRNIVAELSLLQPSPQ